ncbi:MAG: hypothetical protein QME40_05455 [bacterium]|nr:hypothetical protein [bacterium]
MEICTKDKACHVVDSRFATYLPLFSHLLTYPPVHSLFSPTLWRG